MDQDELKSPGTVICKACHSSFARLRSDASPILIIGTDLMLHQIALLENPAINNVVVLSEVPEDVISRNMAVYYRIKAICTNATKNFFVFYSEHHRDACVEEKVEESRNGRTDRAIRVSAHWYQSHQAGCIQILLFTTNRESKKNAIEVGLSSETVESYVRSLDILKGELDDLRISKREIYPEHKPGSGITFGPLHGIYHKGRFQVNRYISLVGHVRSRRIVDEIAICRMVNINRAFGGDIVVVELLPQCQRIKEKSLIGEDVNGEGNVDDAPRNANIAKACARSRPTVSSCLLDRVIGIVKRNGSFYCGSLKPMSLFIENCGIPTISIQGGIALQAIHLGIMLDLLEKLVKERLKMSHKIDPLTTDLHNLNSLAMLMRQRQSGRGTLTLESIEVKFQMEIETHDPLDIGFYPIIEANQMIEEFMLACNFSLAEMTLKHFPLCSLLWCEKLVLCGI